MADDDAVYYDDDFVEDTLEDVCKVYDSDDFFTVAVQLVLAAAALISLWFKRQYERPKRTFRTWFLDVSKQGIGACYAHVCNMVGLSRFKRELSVLPSAHFSHRILYVSLSPRQLLTMFLVAH
jgi:hypothetical protein